MHELALIILDTCNVGPLEVVQNTASVDEELRFIINNSVCGDITNPELPNALRRIPLGMFNSMLELHVFVEEIVLFIYALEVVEDLWRIGVEVSPCLDSPRKLIVNAGDLWSSVCVNMDIILDAQEGIHHKHTQGTCSQARFLQCRDSFRTQSRLDFAWSPRSSSGSSLLMRRLP